MNMLTDAFHSLGKKINKVGGRYTDHETEEGVVSDKIPELTLDMDNSSLIDLTKGWKKNWEESEAHSIFVSMSEENENYWKGNQHDQAKVDKSRAMVDNVIFEGVETYIPSVIKRNPDPMIKLARGVEETEENLAFTKELQKELGDLSDDLVLKSKLKKATRFWMLYLLGVAKFGWDLDENMPSTKVLRPHKLILDPDSTIDENGKYTGEYLGEYRKLQAGNMLSFLKEVGGEEEGIKKVEDLIDEGEKKDRKGTSINFIEWWTNEYMCWTLGDKVLMKTKNPHWNYENQREAPYTDQGEPQVDAEGNPVTESVDGNNHFVTPQKPYIFLSVFNLGKKPIDETSLVTQNLSNQDLVNKRNKQIDKNADNMNGGLVISGERSGLTEKQASKASRALRNGGAVWIPSGDARAAIDRYTTPGLPSDIFNQLSDTRARIRDIMGVRGLSSAGLQTEKTVRGKFQNQNLDTSRQGGGITEHIEQFADQAYNWLVQLLYVYDEKYIGKTFPKLKISVKEGSLIPKDPTTLANQAVDLASAGLMSRVDLYKALDYPNPEEKAANSWLEANAPEVLYGNDPRIAQVRQAQQEAAAAEAAANAPQPEEETPSISMSFKDLPVDGKIQAAEQAGIVLDPNLLAAQEMLEQTSKMSPVPPKNNK